MFWSQLLSPIGPLTFCVTEKGISYVLFSFLSNKFPFQESWIQDEKKVDPYKKQFEEYFLGIRKKFTLPIDTPYGTLFQQSVWEALCEVPYGEAVSYQDIAIQLGDKKLARAVGSANNKNPLPILVPCHRVVGKNGSLVGYAGGLHIKEQLLELERSF